MQFAGAHMLTGLLVAILGCASPSSDVATPLPKVLFTYSSNSLANGGAWLVVAPSAAKGLGESVELIAGRRRLYEGEWAVKLIVYVEKGKTESQLAAVMQWRIARKVDGYIVPVALSPEVILEGAAEAMPIAVRSRAKKDGKKIGEVISRYGLDRQGPLVVALQS